MRMEKCPKTSKYESLKMHQNWEGTEANYRKQRVGGLQLQKQ